MLERIKHTLEIFIEKDSESLILGSFPSIKSREFGFYYSHPQNMFFPVLAFIFNEETPETIEEKKTFLKKHKIALYDVIEECDIVNSDDSSIKNVIPVDIEKILKDYPNIKRIAITGKKAQKLFDKYLLDKVNVPVIYLPSTSPANGKMKISDLALFYRKIFE